MRALVLGAGAVGARAARQLHATDGLEALSVCDVDAAKAAALAHSLGTPTTAVADQSGAMFRDADVVVLATPDGHRGLAEKALEHGAHVVSTADGLHEVRQLLDLDAEARERALTVVVGGGFSPGLSCVLARHAAAGFEHVDEVHVAAAGTGGPACARAHHRALSGSTQEWRDGAWVRLHAGTGRELCWFPEPVSGVDCYRAAVGSAVLLVAAFPGLRRASARLAASRRDRITARLPMLRSPHAEGLVGALRVEVRGRRDRATDVRVLGAIDRPALGAGTVAAVAAAAAADGRLSRAGAAGLAELIEDTVPFLQELARRGVRAAAYEGTA